MTKKDDDARTGATVKRAVIDAPRESDKTFTWSWWKGPAKIARSPKWSAFRP